MQHLDPVRRWILSIQIHANQHVEIVQRPVQAKWEGEGLFVQGCVLRRLVERGVHEFWHDLFDEPVSDEPHAQKSSRENGERRGVDAVTTSGMRGLWRCSRLLLLTMFLEATALNLDAALSARRTFLKTNLVAGAEAEDTRAALKVASVNDKVKRYGSGALLYAGLIPFMSRREDFFVKNEAARTESLRARQLCMANEDISTSSADATPLTPTNPAGVASTRLPAPRDEPVLPISSTADKVKGLTIFLVALVGSGFLLNYAFSPNSVFLASPEPKVNEGLRKYAGVIESASR